MVNSRGLAVETDGGSVGVAFDGSQVGLSEQLSRLTSSSGSDGFLYGEEAVNNILSGRDPGWRSWQSEGTRQAAGQGCGQAARQGGGAWWGGGGRGCAV